MAKIAGVYEIVESHNFDELLIKSGVPADQAKKADQINPNAKQTLEVTVDGKKVSLKSNGNLGTHVSELILDGESEERYSTGSVLKSTAKLDGNVLRVESKKTDGSSPVAGSRTYTFSDSGLEIVFSGKDITAKRVYKRL